MARDIERVKLRPADSFDLIRLIARSQSDPRKAVAELVQNSLDAGATRIDLTWWTHRGERALSIRDDGNGVFPDLGRKDALKRLATTIGQSHKQQLSLVERQQLMTLGKYGIGLLGFWSVGRVLEIRSRVRESPTFLLRLREEQRDAEIMPVRAKALFEGETFTEVSMLGVHAAAETQIKPRRLAPYLASELRGQLLSRDVRVTIHDRVARGLAPKEIAVRPARYRGVRVGGDGSLPVSGHADARYELYLIPAEEERAGHVTLECGGSVVADDLTELASYGLDREPWIRQRFEGFLEFPALEVAPGTRRGFVPNAAAQALIDALPKLERELEKLLENEAQRQASEREENVLSELKRVFRPLPRSLPHYQLFRTGAGVLRAAAARGANGERAASAGASLEPEAGEQSEDLPVAPPQLFPPGPLATVRLTPARSRVVVGDARALRAIALDQDGRAVSGAVTYRWHLGNPALGMLELVSADDPTRAVFRSGDVTGDTTVVVTAVASGHEARAEATVEVIDLSEGEHDGAAGIPKPEPVHRPSEDWRSRVHGERWEYNTAHRDYLAVRDDARRRLLYLVNLFAKEVVLRNFGKPGDEVLLEKMVEVLAHAEQPRPRAK